MKVLLYFGYELSLAAPEWAEMSDEVLVKNAKGRDPRRLAPAARTARFRGLLPQPLAGLLVDGIARLRNRCGFDGVYLDGTIEPGLLPTSATAAAIGRPTGACVPPIRFSPCGG